MYTYRTLLVFALLLGLVGFPLRAWGSPADDQYAVAAAHYAHGRWQLAVDEFQVFLRDHAQHSRAHAVRFFLGEALLQLGRYADAASEFETFLRLAPQHGYARQAEFRTGETLLLDGRAEEARGRLEAFAARYPADALNAYVLPYLGEIALGAQDAERAVLHYRAALDRFPSGPLVAEARFGLARGLSLLGRTDEAAQWYQQLAAAAQPELAAAAQFNLGLLYYQQALNAQAIAAWEQLDRRFPDNRYQIECRYWQAAAHSRLKQWDEALETLAPIAVDASDHPLADAVQFLRAEALRHSGRNVEAQVAYLDLLTSAPQSDWADDALQILVEMSFEAERLDEAVERARTFLTEYAQSPLQHRVRQWLGRSLLQQREYAAAADQFQLLIAAADGVSSADLQPLLRPSRYYLAMAHIGQGQTDAALQQLEALTHTPQADGFTPRIDMALASVLVAEKRYQEAIEPLQRFLHRTPQGVERGGALAKLVVCLVETGDLLTAAEHHREYSAGYADHELYAATGEYLAQAAYAAGYGDLAEPILRELATDRFEQTWRVRSLVLLGRLYGERGENQRAAEVLGEVVRLAPQTDLAAEAALARAHALQGQAATEAYVELADRYPHTTQAAMGLFEAARWYHQQRRFNEALQLLERLVAEHGEFEQLDTALYLMAWVMIELQRSDAAVDLFRRLHDEHRDSTYWSDATYRLAEDAQRQGQWDQVDVLVGQLLAHCRTPQIRSHARYLAAQSSVQRGEWAKAEQHLETLLEEQPESSLRAAARYWLAEALYRQQDYSRARPLLEKLLGETAGQQGDWVITIPLRLAQIDAHQQEWSAAQQRVEKLLARHGDFPNRYEADYVLGRCLAAQARFSEARQAYQRAVEAPAAAGSETAAMAQWMIGESYFHQKDYQQAIRAYHRVETLYAYPKWQAAALLQAAKCHELQGDWKQAVRLYAQVMEDYPGTEYAREASQRLRTARSNAGPALR